MAYGVRRPDIRVHQALHGYTDGHRLLASSTALKARESKTALTLSDASGSTVALDASGYITGYSLPESGLYALAKTWPAPEMARPGCVWTHTLLIDFEDLATLPDLSILTRSFRRPAPGDTRLLGYDAPILCQDVPATAELDSGTLRVLRKLLSALYTNPPRSVVCSDGTSAEREAMVLLLWSQQWPKLRRAFRFCTLVVADRSTEAMPFDLQFVPPHDRALRSRFTKLRDADREPANVEPWLDQALGDIVVGANDALRSFLRGYGAELAGGRELFAPLCRTYALSQDESLEGERLTEAIGLLDGPLAGAEARSVRAFLVGRVIEQPDSVGSHELRFAIQNLALLSDDCVLTGARRFGQALWSRDPRLIGELGKGQNRDTILESMFASSTREQLLAGIRKQPSLLGLVLDRRADLYGDAELWRFENGLSEAALDLALQQPALVATNIDAMIDARNGNLAQRICQAIGAETVLVTLLTRLERRRAEQPSNDETPWMAAAASPVAVAKVLSEGHVRQSETLVAIARCITPDDVPNEFGDDPWITAVRRAPDRLNEPSHLFLHGWLLARALGYRSRNQAELMSWCLEDVYAAVLDRRLPDDVWSLLNGRLPQANYSDDWDKGRRLRSGVVAAFIERDLAPLIFGQLMRNDELFVDLASEAVSMNKGRSFLKRVRRALESVADERGTARRAMLKRLM